MRDATGRWRQKESVTVHVVRLFHTRFFTLDWIQFDSRQTFLSPPKEKKKQEIVSRVL